MKNIKRFNEEYIPKVGDGTIELIGPNVDDMLKAIESVNSKLDKIKIKPKDLQKGSDKPYTHKRNSNYSIFVNIQLGGSEEVYRVGSLIDIIKSINVDLKDFKCELIYDLNENQEESETSIKGSNHFSDLNYSKEDLFKVWKHLSEQGWGASDEEENRESFEEWFSENF